MRSAIIRAQSCWQFKTDPQLFKSSPASLSIKCWLKNHVGPTTTFHRDFAGKVVAQIFTATLWWNVEILGVEWIITWNNNSDNDTGTRRRNDDTTGRWMMTHHGRRWQAKLATMRGTVDNSNVTTTVSPDLATMMMTTTSNTSDDEDGGNTKPHHHAWQWHQQQKRPTLDASCWNQGCATNELWLKVLQNIVLSFWSTIAMYCCSIELLQYIVLSTWSKYWCNLLYCIFRCNDAVTMLLCAALVETTNLDNTLAWYM